MAGAADSRNRDGQRYSDWVLMYIQAKKAGANQGKFAPARACHSYACSVPQHMAS